MPAQQKRLHGDCPDSCDYLQSMGLRAKPVTSQDRTLPQNGLTRILWSDSCRLFLQIYCSFPVIQVPWYFLTLMAWK